MSTALASAVLASGALSNVPAQAVAGGTPAPINSYEFITKIEIEGHRGCTGALIDPQWVITSASCFAALPPDAPTARATIGRPDRLQETGTVLDVADVVTHPDRDVALAKLVDPVAGITAVPLAQTPPTQGETLQVAGFGRTSDTWVPTRLQHASFSVDAITSETLSILGTNASTCRGDAGGPALRQRDDGSYELVAINSTSWQSGCLASTETRQGATEARVDGLSPWLRHHVPNLFIQCKSAVPFFAVNNDGAMTLHQHKSPLNGDKLWTDKRLIGTDWHRGRTFAGPDGVVYYAGGNGELRRYRWNGAGWDRWNGSSYEVIDRGWERYTSSAYRNRITADTNGHIYTIEPDGKLHWRSYDVATKQWEHRVVDSNWGQYDLIVAAGDGVLYARTPEGGLFRHHYDSEGQQWIGRSEQIGVGWHTFKTITSAGADVLYGTRTFNEGELLWYRYLSHSQEWVSGRGRHLGKGWYQQHDVTAAPDSCWAV